MAHWGEKWEKGRIGFSNYAVKFQMISIVGKNKVIHVEKAVLCCHTE